MTALQPTRITELSNELTANIDRADSLGIVRLLRQSDAQLFAGWGDYASISDTPILRKLAWLTDRATTLLKENEESRARNLFVFSGCGTSGRIAWLCSRAYNRLLCHLGREPCFRYLIAGGDESLIVSNELPEDDPPQGAEDLRHIAEGAQNVMYFGITCGLAAPYVAGQIDYGMHQSNFTTVLVGFNPVALARDSPIEKWDKTCRDVFLELEKLSQQSDSAVVLNPIIGPEPVTGSSRMKGGSMTEILLDAIFISAISSLLHSTPQQITSIPSRRDRQDHTSTIFPQSQDASTSLHQTLKDGVEEMVPTADLPLCDMPATLITDSVGGHGCDDDSLTKELEVAASVVEMFVDVYRSAYRPAEGVASLLSLAADCLSHQDGHLYYIGADTLGIVGLIDSSEMVDTYGAGLDEIRGFVAGGWGACSNQEGDLSEKGILFRNSLSDFECDILPNLSSHDCVLCLCSEGHHKDITETMDRVLSTPAKCGLLMLSSHGGSTSSLVSNTPGQPSREGYHCSVRVALPHFSVLGVEPIFAGFALKLIVNAISTGANILKGRVYGNTMINLTLANDKLFHRSVDIVSELGGVNRETSLSALLKAIYREDEVEKYADLPVSAHLSMATKCNLVVPVAVVLAGGRAGRVSEALQLVSRAHSLRKIVTNQ